jgi:hypothetical protein
MPKQQKCSASEERREPNPTAPSGNRKRHAKAERRWLNLVLDHSGVVTSTSAVGRALRRLGFSRKERSHRDRARRTSQRDASPLRGGHADDHRPRKAGVTLGSSSHSRIGKAHEYRPKQPGQLPRLPRDERAASRFRRRAAARGTRLSRLVRPVCRSDSPHMQLVIGFQTVRTRLRFAWRLDQSF